MRPFLAAAVFLSAVCAMATLATAEIFVLSTGGQIVGTLVNKDESPRHQYVIETADGTKITLDTKQVKQILRPRPEEAEYEKRRPMYPDTVIGQWELAQWCRDNKLSAQRVVHLRRVIELDPNHVEARRLLGYSKIDGQWITRDEAMIKQGLVKGKGGRWVVPQQKELEENKKKLDTAQQEWCQKLKRWRGWLGTGRDEEARHNIRTIEDPMAVKGLTISLRDDKDPAVRLLLIGALGKIDTPETAMALAIDALADPVEEVRLNCLDQLQGKRRPDIIAYFVKNLKAKDNPTVNLAAIALNRMRDPSAIGPLIDALVTTHKFVIPKPGGNGSLSPSFGTGPGGRPGPASMGVGGGPRVIYQQYNNQPVLDALVGITGVNFNFDKQGWKDWYAAQKKQPDPVDARRDAK